MNHSSKSNVFPIQLVVLWSIFQQNVELRPIIIWSTIVHCHHTKLIVFVIEVFVLEFSTIYTCRVTATSILLHHIS